MYLFGWLLYFSSRQHACIFKRELRNIPYAKVLCEHDCPFHKVGYVSFLEGISLRLETTKVNVNGLCFQPFYYLWFWKMHRDLDVEPEYSYEPVFFLWDPNFTSLHPTSRYTCNMNIIRFTLASSLPFVSPIVEQGNWHSHRPFRGASAVKGISGDAKMDLSVWGGRQTTLLIYTDWVVVWNILYVLFLSLFGDFFSNLTSLLFRWVGSTTN